jgi:hypothetical protein
MHALLQCSQLFHTFTVNPPFRRGKEGREEGERGEGVYSIVDTIPLLDRFISFVVVPRCHVMVGILQRVKMEKLKERRKMINLKKL